MTKQTKWALAVVAFVVTATVARRVGQFEMKDQAEKQIAVLQERATKLQESLTSLNQDYLKMLKHDVDRNASDDRGEEPFSYAKGFNDAVHEYPSCKRGQRDACNHIMMLGTDDNKKWDILYDAQGNYKKNAFELFEKIGGKK